MRELTRFTDQTRAQTLGAALYLDGIENRVDEGRAGDFILWVHDETQMEEARTMLAEFEDNPFAEQFQRARKEADLQKKQVQKKDKALQKRNDKIRKSLKGRTRRGMGKLTLGLIAVSVIVFILTDSNMGGRAEIGEYLEFDSNSTAAVLITGLFADVRSGQVWRLITPIFLHGGFMHILFNMWCMSAFGTMVERLEGWKVLLVLVLVSAVVSNTAQYLVIGPNFRGMSGVVYAVFGYIWMMSYFAPRSGYAISRLTVIFLVGWLALGFSGLIDLMMGPGRGVANTAHAGGLFVGMVWGFVRAKFGKN